MTHRSKFATLLTLGVALTTLATTNLVQTAQAATTWKTVINDTFDSGTLPSHWTSYNGPYGSGADHNCAAPSHSTVSGGVLHMKMFYESSTAGKCGAAWYSAGLTLDRTLSTATTRITTRFRVVSTGGIQAHRIIPMLSPNDGTGIGEQDMCESTPTTFCSTFLHWTDEIGRFRTKYFLDLTQWHTMVFTIGGYHMTSTIDGVVTMDVTGNEFTMPAKLKHVVLQQECDKYGCPTTHSGSEDIQIDSILVETPA